MKLKQGTTIAMLALAALVVFGMSAANATKPKPPPKPTPTQPVTQEQLQHQGQSQGQEQRQDQWQNAYGEASSESVSTSTSDASSDSSANNEGNSLSVESNYEGSAPDIVVLPSNNTAGCQRTYGLSFSNNNGGGGLGWPYRDPSCDFDMNANAADLQGNYDLGWFWRCQKKNSYKQFRSKGEAVESAIEDCIAQNSGENFQVKLIEQQKKDLAQTQRELEAAKTIIEERDRENLRLKNEVSEKRLVEATSK